MSKAKILPATTANLELAARALTRNELVALPTETVYGLAANALDSAAVLKIFNAKNRPSFDPLIVHVAVNPPGFEIISWLAENNVIAENSLSFNAQKVVNTLAESFWPGPLTLVLPKAPAISDLVCSGLNTVGVRMPAHPITQEILNLTQLPLAAPSANRFGSISPTEARHVYAELADQIEYIIDGGRCQVGVESTVVYVDPQTGALTLLRPGGISVESLERALNQSLNIPNLTPDQTTAPLSPGALLSHYAPRKPLKLFKQSLESILPQLEASMGLLLYQGSLSAIQNQIASQGLNLPIYILSQSGSANEAAQNLFAGMRWLDESNAQVLWAQLPPGLQGLDRAIADRLTRAAANKRE